MFKESQKEIHVTNNNEEYIVVYNLYQNVLLFLFHMHTCCYIAVRIFISLSDKSLFQLSITFSYFGEDFIFMLIHYCTNNNVMPIILAWVSTYYTYAVIN